MSSQNGKKEQLTVYGYVKENYKSTIPFELIDLIVLFYDLYYHWYLNLKTCKELIEYKGCFDNGSIFEINGIHFMHILESATDDTWYYGLKIIQIPDDIEYFGSYLELRCDQITNKEFCFRRFQSNSNDPWTYLKLSNIRQYDHLYFSCFVDIKHIKFKQESNKSHVEILEKFPKSAKYKWHIDGELMERLKVDTDINSYPFGDNKFSADLFLWEDHELQFIPQPLLMPLDIYTIVIDVIIENNLNKKRKQHVCEYLQSEPECFDSGIHLKDIINEKSITFDIELEVIGLYKKDRIKNYVNDFIEMDKKLVLSVDCE